MRRIQIKIWPEIESQVPAIIPLDRVLSNKNNPVDLDFSNTSSINSSGLNLLLLTLLKIVRRIRNNPWDFKWPKSPVHTKLLSQLNFNKLLVSNVPNHNLFWQAELERQENREPVTLTLGELSQQSYPIYEVQLSGHTDRRVGVELFKEYLIKNFFFLHERFDFELAVYIQILSEMAKNSADHTEGNAYFGCDLFEDKTKLTIKFSFGDLGVGINQRIRHFVKNDPAFKNKARHLAITDSYHYALREGTTTRPNSGINKGIGMSTIFNLSKQLDMSLSVYDAESRGILSNAGNNGHIELRKVFYTIGFKVGFYYFGEIDIKK